MKICQLTENLLPGDAISDDVLALDRALRGRGWETALFTAHNAARVRGAERAERLPERLEKDDLLLYQMSIGSALTDWFSRQTCRRAIVYHNITPERFFAPYDAARADAARLGRAQLAALAGRVDFALAHSDYSARELVELGFSDVTALPVMLDFSRFSAEPDAGLLARWRDGRKNLLFVGRKAPNKCVEDVMLAADYYAAAYGKPCRLLLAGDDSLGVYCGLLRELRSRLDAEIVWMGRVPPAALAACYRAADLFLCMSEHEGFCVPLVECMHAGVPVLAYAAAAVPETLGGSGVTFAEKRFDRLAPAMDALLYDDALRERVIAGERARLAAFAPERTAETLDAALRRRLL